MQCLISKNALVELIGKVQSIVLSKPPLPILSHVLLEARNGELIVTATDLTVGLRVAGVAKIMHEGALSIPARRFFQLIREVTHPTLEISCHQNTAEIRAGSAHFRLHGIPKDNFPALPDFSHSVQFKVTAKELKEALHRSSFAASRDDVRPMLMGISLQIAQGVATFTGADGKRLARTEMDIILPPEFSGEYVVPLKAIEEILRLLPENEEEITCFLAHDRIAIETGRTLLTTKLIAGEYPDFTQVLAARGEHVIPLHREELISMLRQVSLFAEGTSQAVRFLFTQGELVLSAQSASIGEGRVSMPVNYLGSAPLEVAFHPHLFLDVLRHSKEETVQLALSDAFNPGILTDNSRGLFLVMPMRLREHVPEPARVG